ARSVVASTLAFRLSLRRMIRSPGFSRGTWRTLLILGRVSNLPTVWSNGLTGWVLGGGGDWDRFLALGLGLTALYLGGMYLNDAFDAQFDAQHRPERPIPRGAIGVTTVWKLGLGWLGTGLLILVLLGTKPALFAALLTVSILVYDAVHKMFAFSPVLMAACRLFVILLAASAGDDGVNGLSVWSALVLAAYVAGLSYIARGESMPTPLRHWPCLLLTAPLVLALIVNRGPYQPGGLLLGGILLVWMLRSLRPAFRAEHRNPGRSVAGLLAGICLVDLLAVGPQAPWLVPVFVGLFVLALLGQRFIPAT
ncbi:MAG TPA: UbiA family prenyltransferase, partial [Methylomirabilota bacterium]|nr:UbiA family prenyltransferase [Methylomirabilota bacterium]